MGKLIDLTGKRFGKLTVIELSHIKGQSLWKCICDCGNQKLVRSRSLISGKTKSCGCLRRDAGHQKLIDLSGKRFGRLTVIEFSHSRKIGVSTGTICYWKCICDCGNVSSVAAESLTSGHTKSCGCLNREIISKPLGVASFNLLLSGYRRNATKRGVTFSISEEEFKNLTKENCFYCGKEPLQTISKKTNGEYVYNGIDRLDSSKGYDKGNVVPCCGRCNQGKMDLQLEEFFLWIEQVYNHSILPVLKQSDLLIKDAQ